jgi:uncharacterized protein YuzE
MKVIYDRETDTLSLLLSETPIAESDELRKGLIVDYDAEGHVVSLEILDASHHLASPISIAVEMKGVAA